MRSVFSLGIVSLCWCSMLVYLISLGAVATPDFGEWYIVVEITFPRLGVLASQTFFPGFKLLVRDDVFLQEHRNDARLCFSIDNGTTATCLPLDSASGVVEDAPPGPTAMTAWVIGGMGQILSDRSSPVYFQVATDEQMPVGVLDERPQLPQLSGNLLNWYRAQRQRMQRQHPPSQVKNRISEADASSAPAFEDENERRARALSAACERNAQDAVDPPLLVVIGVKTAIGHFDRRQAARETWMSKELGPRFEGRVCLQFITGYPSPEFPTEIREALSHEAFVYGDLLLESKDYQDIEDGEETLFRRKHDFFGAQDSYDNLLEKTTGFFQIAIERFGRFRFLFMMDDDVYVRIDQLVEALEERPSHLDAGGFYAGQVFEDEMGRPIRPQRHTGEKNAVSYEEWPLKVLPRFAIGPHYLLSRYCVEFIAINRGWLRGVGTLEDLSVATWMLALQVHPLHLDNFTDNKLGCADYAMSMANIGPVGLRAVHANVAADRPLCTGYDEILWASYIP